MRAQSGSRSGPGIEPPTPHVLVSGTLDTHGTQSYGFLRGYYNYIYLMANWHCEGRFVETWNRRRFNREMLMRMKGFLFVLIAGLGLIDFC